MGNEEEQFFLILRIRVYSVTYYNKKYSGPQKQDYRFYAGQGGGCDHFYYLANK